MSEQAKHTTLGPWTWSDNGYMGTGIGKMYLTGHGNPILEVDAGVMNADECVTAADRALIAAAPDLYDACKLLLDCIDGNYAEAGEIARAALAKAEGRAS